MTPFKVFVFLIISSAGLGSAVSAQEEAPALNPKDIMLHRFIAQHGGLPATGVTRDAAGARAVAPAPNTGFLGQIITFDAPGAGTGSGQGTGCFEFTDCSVLLNNFGVISGYYLDANNVFHGFVRSPDGRLTKFDAPGADLTPNDFNGTIPEAINDLGVITGFYVDVNNLSHGFLRSPDGVFTTFDVPDSAPGSTTPIALNLEGAVVGYSSNQNGVTRAFLRNPDGTFKTWTGPGACNTTPANGCYGTGAHGINLFGTVSSGYNSVSFVEHGLIRSAQGQFTTYSAPGAGTGPYQGTGCPGCARPINLFGAIAGYYIDADNVVHGYLRGPWGAISAFDAPPEAGSYGFNCYGDCFFGLNDEGAMTGFYLDANNVNHGWVRSPEGTITSFDAPGADLTPNNYNGTFPVNINDQGAITGFYIDVNNVSHGFLWLPYGN
jgi:hypothetical protein